MSARPQLAVIRQRWLSRPVVAALVALTTIVVICCVHNVPTLVTSEDRVYAARILAAAGFDSNGALRPHAGFEQEIQAIVTVQDAVLKIAPVEKGIPFYRNREPKDVFELKHGLCFDRSRVIEKILGVLGFETRHVAVYTVERTTVIGALLAPGTPSHAMTEVRTSKGWLPIDSNTRWIGLDTSRSPISLNSLHDTAASLTGWAPESKAPINAIFHKPFIQIRGLYSRHGKFYPPFTFLPDVNFGQLLQNFGP